MIRASMLVALMFCANVVHADIWNSLSGRWTGTGEVSGMHASVAMEFRPTLEGRGHHLAFFNRMQTTDGKEWRFRAEALYQCKEDGTCVGHWYDSRGAILPLKTVNIPDGVVVDWGDETTERGRTTYRLRGKDQLVITDEVLGKDGVWKAFGTTTAERRTD